MGRLSDLYNDLSQQQAEAESQYIRTTTPGLRMPSPEPEPVQQEQEEEPGLLSDAWSSFGIGAGQLVKGVEWLFDTDTEVGQTTIDYWQGQLSDAQVEANEQRFVDEDMSLGEGFSNPRTWMGTIVQSLPMMVPGIGAAGGVAKLGIRAGMSKAGATAAGAAAGSGVEGATIGALVGEEVEKTIMEAPIEELQNSPYFQDLIESGKDEAEARLMVAEKASEGAALQSGVVGAILGVAFNKFVGDAVTGRLSERLLKETGKGVAEGSVTEAAQTGVESYSKQTALNESLGRPYDYSEAANEMVGGTGAGGVMGGAVGFGGGLAGSNTPEQPTQTEDNPPIPQPDAGLQTEPEQPTQPAGPDEPAFDDGLDNIGQRLTDAENQPISIRNRSRNLAAAPEAPAPLSEQVGTDINAEGPQIVYQQDGITVEQEDNQFRAYNEDGLEAFGQDAADARRKLNRQIERNWPKGPILQNRDRNTPAYIAQMREIAQNPKYNRVSTSREPTTGAPMAFPRGVSPEVPAMNLGRTDTVTMSDGKGGEREVPVQYAVVEADQVQASHRADGKENPGYAQDGLIALNNGRTAGLQAAYEQGNTDAYVEAMLADDMHGIDPAAIRSKQRPMLVRLFDGQSLEGIDNPGDASNTSPMADLSLSEQAKTDAGKLDNAILSEIQPGDPTGSGNTDFVTRAVDAIGKGDTDTVMRDREGLLTSAGQRRIRGALIARAYSDDTLTQELVEATDSDLKTLGDALTEVAGRWALMREQARDNAINPDMDVTDALVIAVNMIRKSRQEGRSLKDIAGQIDAFAGEADQMAVYMLSLFYRGASFNRIRSKDAIAGALSNYIETALQSSPGVDMFGEQTQPQEVLSREAEQAEGSTGEQAQEAAPRVRTDGPDNRDAGPEGEGSGRETGREENAGSGEQVSAAGETENLTPDLAVEVEQAGTETDTNPSDGQKEAGNYKKGKVRIQGMEIAIENPKGSTRSGTDPDGNRWESTMAHHYGDIKGTKAADGDNLDVFIGPYPEIDQVFVIDQPNADGSFDEHKVMLGFANEADARQGYLDNYEDGWKVGPITRMTMDEFKAWMQDGDTTKPVARKPAKPQAKKPEAKKPEPKAESKPEPKRKNTVTAQGVTIRVPTIDQQLIDDFNRNTYIAGKRDLNQELRDTAESVLNSLADKPNTLVMDEQKAKAKELIEAYIEKEAEFARWDASYNARNPSWIVTGRSNRNMEKANRKNEKHMDEYSRRVGKLDAQRKRIETTLYEMRPDSVKADQAVKADQRRITQLVADIAGDLAEGRESLAKETRKWASPKAHKAMEKALERDRAATIGYLQEIEASETVVNMGGLAKILGPRSKAGKLVTELLGDSVESRRSSYRPNPGQNDLFADADALQQLELDDAYDNLETRPHTTQAQRRAGRSALRDFFRQLNARLERQGQLPADGGGVSLLGAAIYKNFKEGKPNQLIGQTVRTPRDLAALAQVYRDPRFETFRFILTRNGEVVSEQAITSRLPAAVSFQNIDATIADLKQSMADFEADGYYMLHNHPSGKSSPSAADFAFTDKISEEVPGYIQHVVIDTNEYSVIGRKDEGFETIKDDTLGSTDFWGNPESPHDILGAKITGPETLGEIAKTLQQPDRAVFVGTTARGEVALVTSFPGKTVRSMMNRTASKKRQVEAAAIIRRLRRASGSGGYGFLVVSNETEARALKNLMSSGTVRDIVTPEGFSLASVELRGFSRDLMDALPKKTMRVADKQTGYRRTPETRTDALTAQQARTYANTLMRDWKDRPGVTVADSISEFPRPLREAIRQAGAESDMRAVFWNQEVYILAPRIPNTQALEEVILHEVVGHYGLRKMVGKELIPLLNRVYMDMSKTEQAAEIKRSYFPGNTFDAGNREHRLVVAEELLAHLAESGKQRHRTLWQRIVTAVRDGLRRLGFTVSMNENDLLKILEGAQRTVEQGGFSRPSDADTYFRRAYHGTPHRFDKFSLEAIGTGEGAQAYGWGLYFAGNRQVAEYYREALSTTAAVKNKLLVDGVEIPDDGYQPFAYLKKNGGDLNDAIAEFESRLQAAQREATEYADILSNPDEYVAEAQEYVTFLNELENSGQKIEAVEVPRGNLYEVEIPDDSDLLDWDAPLDRQSESVQAALRKLPGESYRAVSAKDYGGNPPTGSMIYNRLQEYFAAGRRNDVFANQADFGAKDASQELNDIGIPGLRYLDGSSRQQGEGSHNYVIWDESVVSVQAVNDEIAQAEAYFRRAYHGTPHRFDKFSLSAIGTGEGAQAYGYGLYFAEKREIAEYYKDVLSNDRMDDAAPDDVAEAFFDELSKDSATGDTVTVGDNQTRMTRADFIEAWMDEDIGPFDFSPAVRTAVEQKFSGNLYEVEIPEDSKLLDWGKRLDDQPEGITDAVRAVTDEYHGEGAFDSWLEANEEGGDYREWADNLMEDMSPQEISQALNDKGVPGLRYLDAVSRIPGEDGTTYNYVIWDDSLVSVQAINDQMAQAEAYFSRTGQKQTDTEAFSKWFGDSKVVDENGEPLVVYHGTAADITQFDPLLLGGSTSAPSARSAFFVTASPKVASGYALLSPSRSAMDVERMRQAAKSPALNDETRQFLEDQAEAASENLDSSEWAGSVTQNLGEWAQKGANVLPVYISMQNPMEVDYKGNSYRERKFSAVIKEAKEKGHDGVIFRNADDSMHKDYDEITDIFAVFEPSQIKSATGNSGAFNPANPDIRFSRAGNRLDAAATHFNDLTDDQRAALGKIAPRTPKERAQDWLKERADRWQTKVRQGAVDRFAALADVDTAAHGRDVIENSTASSSWVLAQMSGSAAGALQSMLTTARVKLNQREKVITTQDGTQGLNDTLKQLGSAAEIERFFGWIAGNRSRRLMAEGRENLFEPQEVEALAQLNRGTTDSGQSRLTLYDNVFREFQQYRDDVLAIAEQSGIITPEQRETWANEFYVPFYRLAEDDGSFTGPKATGGISRQEAYKKLKGGSRPLNDLLENTMMNFYHLLQASLKNQAAMQAMDNSQEMGIAREVREADRDTENSTFILRDGQKIWYEIDDPLVFKAVTALAHPGMNSTAMKMMRGFKRLFTNLTTTTPQFVIANLLRDSMQAAATSEVSKNILKNMAQGSKVYGDPKIRAKMLASGGSFSFGHLYGENADELRLRITGGLAQADILRSPSMIPNAVSGMWRKWNEMTEFTENINRAAIFEQNQDRGELYAAFKARDLMNFSQHGAWPAMRVLIDVVPFLNARLQGLDKIYRSGVKPGLRTAMGQGTASEKQAAMRFWSVTGTLALASIALYLNNRDDEEYKKLEEWQKDTYWFFRVSDDHAIFIPKPFEVGAIATMAERLTEQAVSDTATGKLFAERLSHMLLDTFSFSPVPQMFQPALDIYSNYDAFTGRPIESMGMDRLSPSLRRRNNTTALATGLSAATESVFGSDGRMTLSPVQIDHAIQGYFGSVGSWVAGIADTVWRTANGETAPSTFWYENQPVRRFYKNLGDEDRYTRYGTVFYEALKETNRVYADIKEYAELGEVEKARSLYQENRNKLAYRVILNRVQRKLSEINIAMQKVRRLEASPEYKRRELDRLRAMKNRIQEAVGGNMERLNASDS